MEKTKSSIIGTIFGMMINPAGSIKQAVYGTRWYLGVAVSAAAFGLFFAQTGLDLYKTGQKGFSFLLLSAGAGILYGLLFIPLLGVLVWLLLKAARSEMNVKQTIASFCLSYSGALIYGIIGLAVSLALGWKTSVAFGVTGVLWAIGPMIMTIRELTTGRQSLGIPVATVISAIVLVTWALFGNL